MRAEEFRKLLVKHTETTANVCAYKNWDHSKVDKVNDAITAQIGQIVAFLQAKVEEGLFCKKDECLMVYNFQPVCVRDDLYLCSLDMMIKPLNGTDALKNKGLPLTLVINGGTGEIGNAAYGLAMITGKKVQDENEVEAQKPLVYGKYNNEICAKAPIIALAKQLSQELEVTTGDLKDKSCQPKEIKSASKQKLGGAPIHFSFQRTRSPKREVFRNPLAPIPEVSDEPFHIQKPVLHRLRATAA